MGAFRDALQAWVVEDNVTKGAARRVAEERHAEAVKALVAKHFFLSVEHMVRVRSVDVRASEYGEGAYVWVGDGADDDPCFLLGVAARPRRSDRPFVLVQVNGQPVSGVVAAYAGDFADAGLLDEDGLVPAVCVGSLADLGRVMLAWDDYWSVENNGNRRI